MKKTIIAGAFAAALIVGGGTGAYMSLAKDQTASPATAFQQQGLNVKQMTNTVNPGNSTNSASFEDLQQYMQGQNVNFGQMKSYMKQMHPDLTDKQIEDLYKNMHGTGGSSNSANFQGMMGTGTGNGNL